MASESDDLTLELKRVLSAPAPAVFAAFSEPEELAQWWGPHGFTNSNVDFHPRVGGTYGIEMQPPEGESFLLTGVFRDVDPPARLAFTFVWEPPDSDDVETVAALSFRDVEGSTEVDFTQGPFKTEERRALHRDGWTESFDRLEHHLTRRSAEA
jgi:uncharacterized protein YndB with AHSA1/START domain